MSEQRREHSDGTRARSTRRGDPGATDVGGDERWQADSASGASDTTTANPNKQRSRADKKARQQANPGDVSGGFGEGQGEPNPGNRNVHGGREQADLDPDKKEGRARHVDRGTH